MLALLTLSLLTPLFAAAGSGATQSAPGLFVWTGNESAERGLEWQLPDTEAFDRAVLSWNATGPATFTLEVDGREYVMGHWGERPRSETTASVDKDTLKLPRPAKGLTVRVRGAPGTTVTLLAITFWRSGAGAPLTAPAPETRRGAYIQGVRHRVQGRDLCSPTSLWMVLDYYGVAASPSSVAAGVRNHDPAASQKHGNWPFNTAYAASVSGGRLRTYVRRMRSLADLEREILAGRPAIVSYTFQIDPDGRNRMGHVAVLVGFTPSGDVVLNDPARSDGAGYVIGRADFHNRFFYQGSSGIAYVLEPAQ